MFREKDASKQTATHSQSSVTGSVNVSSSQAVALDANITQTLEDRVITSTWLDNTTDYIVNNQRDKLKEELDEQRAIVRSLNINTTNSSSNNIMNDSMNTFEDDFMNEVNEQRGTTTVTSTSTEAMTSSDTTSTTRVASSYTPLSHLNTQTIMETREESLFNQRKRVRLVNTVARPFNPISTLNFHLPNDLDPITNRPLTPERLVEFDQFSRGLANEAQRRMPAGCIVGNFSNDEMVEERKRQYSLYENARATVLQDRITKSIFPHPNDSPTHTTMDYIDSTMDFIDYTGMHKEESSDEESSDNDELPTANLSPLERVENLYQSDCSNERRKRKLRKDNEGKAVAPEESESESEDNSDDESTEQDHEES